MKRAICVILVYSEDDAVEQGWTPYSYESKTEHELACLSCAETFLYQGEDGEMEVREEYRGKIRFLDRGEDGNTGEHLVMGIGFKEPDGEMH